MSQDPFATASTEFRGLGDLEGRAVLVVPLKMTTGHPSTRPGGGTYDRIEADTIVLDGDVDHDLEIDELPHTFEGMYISGAVVVPQLRNAVPKAGRNPKPVLGVVEKQPARQRGNNPAVLLNGEIVTDKQKELARAAWEQYLADMEDPFSAAAE